MPGKANYIGSAQPITAKTRSRTSPWTTSLPGHERTGIHSPYYLFKFLMNIFLKNQIHKYKCLIYCYYFLFQVWDDELALVSQRWADQCTAGHDRRRAVGKNNFTFQMLF